MRFGRVWVIHLQIGLLSPPPTLLTFVLSCSLDYGLEDPHCALFSSTSPPAAPPLQRMAYYPHSHQDRTGPRGNPTASVPPPHRALYPPHVEHGLNSSVMSLGCCFPGVVTQTGSRQPCGRPLRRDSKRRTPSARKAPSAGLLGPAGDGERPASHGTGRRAAGAGSLPKPGLGPVVCA